MQVPTLSDLNELNRIVSIANDLVGDSGKCDKDTLVNLCSASVFGGYPRDHYRTLGLCKRAGLLRSQRNRIELTKLGSDFISANPLKQYEITEEQRKLIVTDIVFQGPWKEKVQKLFMLFDPDYEEVTYYVSLEEKDIPKKHNQILHLIIGIGILNRYENTYKVESAYVSTIRSLRNEARGVTADDLGRALNVNIRLADLGEQAIVEFERRRLRELNKPKEADLVRRISQLDTSAGYDIQSFDGDKPAFEYDRFIEVKTSQQDKIRFYWTANEKKVAKEKNDNYWIYFLGGFKEDNDNISPQAIRNPINKIQALDGLDTKVAVYLIEENGKHIPTKSVSFGIDKIHLL